MPEPTEEEHIEYLGQILECAPPVDFDKLFAKLDYSIVNMRLCPKSQDK